MFIQMTPEQAQAAIDSIESEIEQTIQFGHTTAEDLESVEYTSFLAARAGALAALKAAKRGAMA